MIKHIRWILLITLSPHPLINNTRHGEFLHHQESATFGKLPLSPTLPFPNSATGDA